MMEKGTGARLARVVQRVGLICAGLGPMLGCGGGATSDDPVTINGMAAAGPAVSGWTVRLDDFDCRHVAVEARCENHWCRIPAGCFIMGSPETEPGRGMADGRTGLCRPSARRSGASSASGHQTQQSPPGWLQGGLHRDFS